MFGLHSGQLRFDFLQLLGKLKCRHPRNACAGLLDGFVALQASHLQQPLPRRFSVRGIGLLNDTNVRCCVNDTLGATATGER